MHFQKGSWQKRILPFLPKNHYFGSKNGKTMLYENQIETKKYLQNYPYEKQQKV